MLENPAIITGSPGSQQQAPELKSIIAHPFHDMLNHLIRSLIDRHSIVLGDFPHPLYHKYLDSIISYPKALQINESIMNRLSDKKYDEIE